MLCVLPFLLYGWAAGQSARSVGSVVTTNQKLTANQYLISPNGRYRAIMQTDGNFVVYGPSSGSSWGSAVWASSTFGSGYFLIMQNDCNLVMYSGSTSKWHSNTWGKGTGCRLVLQADRNLVIYTPSNSALWAIGKVDSNWRSYTYMPTSLPTVQPTIQPTQVPSTLPSTLPTITPSQEPTRLPTPLPTGPRSPGPSRRPTPQPTVLPVSALPGGSYLGSCTGCNVSFGTLSCRCKDRGGAYKSTSVVLGGCNKIHNVNGVLTKDATCTSTITKLPTAASAGEEGEEGAEGEGDGGQ